jgi:hypothetical protein
MTAKLKDKKTSITTVGEQCPMSATPFFIFTLQGSCPENQDKRPTKKVQQKGKRAIRRLHHQGKKDSTTE